MPNERAAANPRPKGRARSVADARATGMLTTSKATAAMVDPDKPLTDVQRQFVRFWASGESPSSAAARCGIQTSYAYRLIYMPNVLLAYRAEKEAYEAASGMNRKKVVDGILEAIEMSKTMAEPSTMVAGWREIGKICGYYEPVTVKHQISVEGKLVVDRMEKMSDDELMQLIEKRMADAAQAAAGHQALLETPENPDGAADDTPDDADALGDVA